MGELMNLRNSVLLFLVAMAGCGAPVTLPDQPSLTMSSDGGGVHALVSPLELDVQRVMVAANEQDDLRLRFLGAELDRFDGLETRALSGFADVAVEAPNSLMGLLSLLRLNSRIGLEYAPEAPASTVAQLRGRALHPLAAILANDLALHLAALAHESIGPNTDAPLASGEYGVPTSWRGVGPLGYLPTLGLDEPLPTDDVPVLGERYQVAGREIETRTLDGGGADGIDLLASDSGVYILETWANAERGDLWYAVLDAGAGVDLWIDQTRVATRRDHGPYTSRTLIAAVELSEGWHRIRIIAAAQHGQARLRLRLVPPVVGPSGLIFSPRGPDDAQVAGARTSPAVSPASLLPREALRDDGSEGRLLDSYAALRLATEWGDDATGRAALAILADGELGGPAALLAGQFVLGQQDRSITARANAALAYVRSAADGAPSSARAALVLSEAVWEQGNDDEALSLLLPHLDRHPAEPWLYAQLAGRYLDLGLDEQAESSLSTLLELSPGACSAVSSLAELFRYRDERPPVEQLPPAFRECESGQRYQVDDVLIPRGEVDEALTLLDTLIARNPYHSGYLGQRINLLMRQERWTEADQALDAAEASGIPASRVDQIRADLLTASGRESEAMAVLEALVADEPADLDARRLRAVTTRQAVLPDLRLDPFIAIAEFEASGFRTTAPVVYVLDYAARRLFEDGSGLVITHQIIQVLSRDALGEYGEVNIPGGATLLRVRTIKADGTVLEPESIMGKDAISVPNLEVGDYVEMEYLETIGVPRLGNLAMYGSRFYFQIFDAPLAISQLVVEVPRAWGDLLIDLRGDVSSSVDETESHRRYIFEARHAEPVAQEPLTPALDEVLPSVTVAYGLDWPSVCDPYRDQLASLLRPTPEMDELVSALMAYADDDRERIRRIYRFAMDEIDDTGQFLATPAIWTVLDGEGESLTALIALLNSAGFRPDLVFARSKADDQTDSPIPETDVFPRTLVRVQLGGDELWLDPSSRFAPFDYIDPSLQGSVGLVVNGPVRSAPEWVALPSWPAEDNTHTFDVQLVVDENGDATGHIVEHVSRDRLASLRLGLEMVQDPRVLSQTLERALSSSFPGVVMTDFNTEGTGDPDEPLVLSYSFEVPQWFTVRGDQMELTARTFDRQLGSTLGSEASRQYPLQVDYPLEERLDLTIRLPEGWTFSAVPDGSVIETPVVNHSWTPIEGGEGQGTVVLRRLISMPIARVSPAEYAALTEQLQRIDLAERLRFTANRE